MSSNGEGEHLLLISQIGRPSLCPSTLLKLATPLSRSVTHITDDVGDECAPSKQLILSDYLFNSKLLGVKFLGAYHF